MSKKSPETKNIYRTLVCGDIHGGHKALLQCLERSQFNYDKDKLIVLGDIVDGWPETVEVIEELKKIKNLVLIMGNHDAWCAEWLRFGAAPIIWTQQGGQATIDSFLKNPDKLVEHRNFFDRAHYYYIDEKNRLFIHGGFDPDKYSVQKTPPEELMWDRTLAARAYNGIKVKDFSEVYLGHTTTWDKSQMPVNRKGSNVWLLDQGGGWEGKLTMMEINTKLFWQSDIVSDLYPEHLGRSGKRKLFINQLLDTVNKKY